MGIQVTTGAMMTCTFGAAPSTLAILPKNKVMAGTPAGNIMDKIPMMNIPPFGVCMSLANPQVAAMTAAALGVLTPQPCLPVLPAPWVPGSPTVMIAGMPALTNSCQLMCAWGGMIAISNPGQTTVMTA